MKLTKPEFQIVGGPIDGIIYQMKDETNVYVSHIMTGQRIHYILRDGDALFQGYVE